MASVGFRIDGTSLLGTENRCIKDTLFRGAMGRTTKAANRQAAVLDSLLARIQAAAAMGTARGDQSLIALTKAYVSALAAAKPPRFRGTHPDSQAGKRAPAEGAGSDNRAPPSRAMAAYNQFFPFVSALRMAAGVLTNGT